MSETPVPRDPGQDDNPPGVPAGPGDRPSLGSPHWRLVPQSPDWPEWMDEGAHADDEDPGDPDLYQDPDNAPPAGLDDAELEALLAEAREAAGDQARAAAAMGRLGHTAVLAAAEAVSAWPAVISRASVISAVSSASSSPAGGELSGSSYRSRSPGSSSSAIAAR